MELKFLEQLFYVNVTSKVSIKTCSISLKFVKLDTMMFNLKWFYIGLQLKKHSKVMRFSSPHICQKFFFFSDIPCLI